MPENIKVTYHGEVRPDKVVDVFSKYDIFLFPTKGENYGHVIFESMASGCIPVISDKTPWGKKDDLCNYSIVELKDLEGFRDKILLYLRLDKDEFVKIKKAVIDFAENKYKIAVQSSGYREVFGETNCGE